MHPVRCIDSWIAPNPHRLSPALACPILEGEPPNFPVEMKLFHVKRIGRLVAMRRRDRCFTGNLSALSDMNTTWVRKFGEPTRDTGG